MTTDFGLRDPYVAEMKAVIASISPETLVIDITHDVEKFNIRMGAFILAEATSFFPEETIHLAVVDPGVGGQRKPIVIQTKKGFFVGPDNGLMMLAAQSQGVQNIHEIRNAHFTLERISNTFHGRDVFAPVTAHLAKRTVTPQQLGPKVIKPQTLRFAKITSDGGKLFGEVLYIDGFGNVVTNISQDNLSQISSADFVKIGTVSGLQKLKIVKAYAELPEGELAALLGSHNYLEITVNKGNAALKLKMRAGDKITLQLQQEKLS